jgi:NADH-quinone oxidoreductase subunit G
MPTFKIDGKEITVAPGVTVLQAALANGIEIPHYCWHPALSIVGSCRMCLVEIDKSPKLILSCATQVRDGMEVATQTEQVRDARKSMLEFFLINHPIDCAICDKAGECLLQDYTYTYGSSHSRMVEDKRERRPKDLGGNILLYRNRCVLCSRCVRFYEDVVGDPHLIVENRGYHSDISIFPGKGLTHKMTGNIVEICPVGCLIDKDFLFHARVWNLKKTNSICPGCSSGCNVYLEHKDNRVFRIRSRENIQVNKEWICDDGRYLYHQYENLARPAGPVKQQSGTLIAQTWPQAIEEAATTLQEYKKGLAVVGSSFATLEENYLLRKIFKDTLACENSFVYNKAVLESDIVYKSGFTIHGDKSPNSRGAELLLGKQTDFYKAIEAGRITSLFILGGDVLLNLSEEQKRILQKLQGLWVLDIQENALTALAHHFWPIACFTETQGAYINDQGHVQCLQAALQPPDGVKPGWQVLLQLLKALVPTTALVSAGDVLNDLAATIPGFSHISYFTLGDQGLAIKTR